MNDLHRIDQGLTPAAPAAASAPSGGASAANFQRLLESLQKLVDENKGAKVDDADQLREAIRVADDGFVTAMDLRKKLEAAFRNHAP